MRWQLEQLTLKDFRSRSHGGLRLWLRWHEAWQCPEKKPTSQRPKYRSGSLVRKVISAGRRYTVTTSAAADIALLDTNVLVYALDKQSNLHAASRGLLLKAGNEQSNQRFCVTPQVLSEFYSVVTNPRRVQNPRTAQEALDAIERLMALPGLTLLAIPLDIVSRWISLARQHPISGSDVFDVQLVATMLANGVRKIFTFDRAHFERFNEIDVLTPQSA
jgi:toxin-antitoxin system PIN domain toxin